LDFEFDPKDSVFVRIDRRRKLPVTIFLRALGLGDEEILSIFFDNDNFFLADGKIEVGLIPQRWRGENASFDIKIGRKTIVSEGKRITARHVKELEKSSADTLEVPMEFLEGKILAHAIIDEETGEILMDEEGIPLAEANAELTEELIQKLFDAGVQHFRTLYVNDLDEGPYISNTLRVDPSSTQLEALVEIYRMMRPGEPPTKDAAENLFNNLFFNPERYDLSGVGRMKFNRRVGRDDEEGTGVLDQDDVLAVLQVLMISTISVIVVYAALVKWQKTHSVSALFG
jgi:DNA-directed RNA polymerase subunit beta